jgi:hypothetical protein
VHWNIIKYILFLSLLFRATSSGHPGGHLEPTSRIFSPIAAPGFHQCLPGYPKGGPKRPLSLSTGLPTGFPKASRKLSEPLSGLPKARPRGISNPFESIATSPPQPPYHLQGSLIVLFALVLSTSINFIYRFAK